MPAAATCLLADQLRHGPARCKSGRLADRAEDCGKAIIKSFGHALDAWVTGVEQGQVLVFHHRTLTGTARRRIDTGPETRRMPARGPRRSVCSMSVIMNRA